MSNREYIPKSDSELLNCTNNIIACSSTAFATSTLVAVKWQVPAANVFLTQPLTDFEEKYNKTLYPHRSLISNEVRTRKTRQRLIYKTTKTPFERRSPQHS